MNSRPTQLEPENSQRKARQGNRCSSPSQGRTGCRVPVSGSANRSTPSSLSLHYEIINLYPCRRWTLPITHWKSGTSCQCRLIESTGFHRAGTQQVENLLPQDSIVSGFSKLKTCCHKIPSCRDFSLPCGDKISSCRISKLKTCCHKIPSCRDSARSNPEHIGFDCFECRIRTAANSRGASVNSRMLTVEKTCCERTGDFAIDPDLLA